MSYYLITLSNNESRCKCVTSRKPHRVPTPMTLTGVDRSDQAPRSGHVIICGLHDVGLRVVEQLHAAGEQVLVIDDGTDPRLARIVDSLDVPHVIGDASRRETLQDAGLDEAIA